MYQVFRRIVDAFDERTGLLTNAERFLSEEIPGSSGWHQVFGSVALFLILVQFFTGVMLAINYAPTPVEAYDSLRYILVQITAGRFMRGLHHWGASMILVVVVLHMTQVFLWGAYKKPREATWASGVMLILLALAFSLTGYLLPWDNRAYWGTVVTTRILETIPFLGPYASRLMASSGGIGVVTFTRFYVLHVIVLPAASLALIVLHVYLVRRHGVAPAVGDEARSQKPFFPEQLFKDTIAIFIAFAILFTMAAAIKVPLERAAQPGNAGYIPRPEWYFLFVFEALKWFNGPLEVVGTVLLPVVAIIGLTLTPFIDRSQMSRVRQRTTAIAIVLSAALGWCALTAAAIRVTPAQSAAFSVDFSRPTGWMNLIPSQIAAIQYFRKANCANCHHDNGASANTAFGFLSSSRRHDTGWLKEHVKEHATNTENGLTNSQISDLIGLMSNLAPKDAELLSTTPSYAAAGAAVFQSKHCSICHVVNGVGGKVGPVLNGVEQRRTEAWVIEHFKNPAKLSPGTSMPPYSFSTSEMRDIVFYLFTLPDTSSTDQ